MRLTKVCQKLTGVDALVATDLSVDDGGVTFAVRPRWRKPRCGGCGRRGGQYDRGGERHWRHLALGSTILRLRYAPRRVNCRCCGVVTEQVPWARHGSRFTRDLEELVAYLAQTTDKTTITRLVGINWRTVGTIIERVVNERLDGQRLNGLRVIGIDEFSYLKRHRYLTVVVDHDQRRVVWAARGRGADSLTGLFDQLGEHGRAGIELATMDMAGGYLKAVGEHLPDARIVFDRFHVQRLASDALDEVRRAETRALAGGDDAGWIKRSRYALLKNPWNLTPRQDQKLADIQANNARLYRAYLLKESLARALDYRQPKRAREAFEAWLAWACRSQLPAFVKLSRTLRRHKDGILAYIKQRYTNAIVEGFNNRLRMIARRAYGFHSADALQAMLFLCCGGIELNPPLPK